jgi:phospholipase/lecithinase/hemolysin
MKNTFLFLFTAIIFIYQGDQIYASPKYSELVVFGDSLSDSGNVFQLTTDSPDHVQDPPAPMYFDGRATNGFNWIDQLANQLNITRPSAYLRDSTGTNYAFAGAATGNGTSTRFPSPTHFPNPPLEVDNVGTQIDSFLSNNQSFQSDQLVTLWAGAGDLKDAKEVDDIINIVNNLEEHIRTLDSNGAKTVIVPNQLDAGLAPFFTLPNTPDPAVISGATNLFNNVLGSRLELLSEDFSLDINIISVDMPPLIESLLNNDEFINVENAWLLDFSQGTAESANPDDYLFYDVIHPSARAHELIAQNVFSSIATVPTPPTIFLLIAGVLVFRFQHEKA